MWSVRYGLWKMMRCSVAGGEVRAVRNRNLEVAKRGYHGRSCGFNYGVEVSPFAKPTRLDDWQEAAFENAAARQVRNGFCVAVNAARQPQPSSGATEDSAEQKE